MLIAIFIFSLSLSGKIVQIKYQYESGINSAQIISSDTQIEVQTHEIPAKKCEHFKHSLHL